MDIFDAFETLGVERRLTLEDAELRPRYQQLSKTLHPDAGGSESAFRELNEAYEILRSPGRRLRHWLSVGGVEGDPRGTIGGDLLAFFGEVGTVVQHADALLKRRAEARTTLSKALLEREAAVRREEIEAAQKKVDALIEKQISAFAKLDDEGPQMAGDEAWEISRNLGFLEKWRAQLRERYGALF